ncbi:hypothetical protein F5Y19DRAFT_370584 [Xylariaceae sp. FL1651]|nr:hypothetical protein F5Y19DRAFT_370584 [Xylariaceae sp. FL1651]
MRASTLVSLALAILPAALAQGSFSCDPSCQSCGLYCNYGCTAPLDATECSRCLYCRRESSSCGFVDISGSWTEDPPEPAYCAMCDQACHCYIDAQCYDNTTTTTASPSGAPTGAARMLH